AAAAPGGRGTQRAHAGAVGWAKARHLPRRAHADRACVGTLARVLRAQALPTLRRPSQMAARDAIFILDRITHRHPLAEPAKQHQPAPEAGALEPGVLAARALAARAEQTYLKGLNPEQREAVE